MNALLRLREASLDRGKETVGPFDVELFAGAHEIRECVTDRDAATLALLACALVRPSSGTVTIADYDTRIQPAQCKRIAAYIPHDPLPMSRAEFEHHIDYRASLWNVDVARAHTYATQALEALAGVHEAFAYPLAAATIARPQLVVFDRPPRAYVEQMLSVVAPAAALVARVGGTAA